MAAEDSPPAVNPQVLSMPELVSVVVAARKQGLSGTHGGWTDYLKVKLPLNTLKDPARHGRETLSGFVQSLVDVQTSGAAPAAAGPSTSAVQVSAPDPAAGARRLAGVKSVPGTPVPQPAAPGSNPATAAPHPATAPAAKKARTQPATHASTSQPTPATPAAAANRQGAAAASPASAPPATAAATAATSQPHGSSHAAQQAHLGTLEAALRRAQEHAAAAAAEVLRIQREIDALRQAIVAGRQAAAPGCPASAEVPSTSGNSVASLVARSRAHPNFKRLFKLPSSSAPGWTRTGQIADSGEPSASLSLLALDCEMVKTDLEDNALAGVCVVDEHYNVLYKSVVVPEGKVVDYRTPLTGLTEDDFKDVHVTRSTVQAAIGALLTPGTVLVGHALHHDLAALKMDHQPVIDTSFIFSFLNMRSLTPSLKDLAKTVLGVDMRTAGAAAAAAPGDGDAAAAGAVAGRHDSREDACVAMRLVVHELAQPAPTAPLPVPDITVPKEDLAKLLLHALPTDVTEAELRAFLGPTLVSINGSIASRKVLAVFRHASAANEVFKALPGPLGADCMGRASKQVSLAGGDRTVTVRKMSCHNGRAYKPDKPNQQQQPFTRGHKRPRNGPSSSEPRTGGGAPAGGAGSVDAVVAGRPASISNGNVNGAKAKGKRKNKKAKVVGAAAA